VDKETAQIDSSHFSYFC